jgi:hypothetical protein
MVGAGHSRGIGASFLLFYILFFFFSFYVLVLYYDSLRYTLGGFLLPFFSVLPKKKHECCVVAVRMHLPFELLYKSD